MRQVLDDSPLLPMHAKICFLVSKLVFKTAINNLILSVVHAMKDENEENNTFYSLEDECRTVRSLCCEFGRLYTLSLGKKELQNEESFQIKCSMHNVSVDKKIGAIVRLKLRLSRIK